MSKIFLPCGIVEIPELNRFFRALPFAGIPCLLYFIKQMVRTRREPNLFFRFISFSFQISVAPERRCSSRTFRYGYLVTT